ncbi:MAG TPA: DoxX family protein [Gemmatimonadales bacterium]|nr:DoxX family protein [Gemmatimonadales bacterium]
MDRTSFVAPAWGMVPLRVVIGLVFLMHGSQKLLSLTSTAAFFDSIGIPIAQVAAALVTALEILGGVALILGWFTRVVAALLAIDMAVAILTARMDGGFFAPSGFEFELTLLGACLTLAVMGAGGFSLDAMQRQRRGQ